MGREPVLGSGLPFGSNLLRAVPFRLEQWRLAFRREIGRSAWKFNAGRSQLSLPYDAGLEKEDGRTRE